MSNAGDIPVSLDGERFTVSAERPEIARFWHKADSGRWEGDTLRFVRRHAGADAVLVDIGAWIGPISLFASRQMGHVLALEPDPVAHSELTYNVAANGLRNIDIWHAGIDAVAGTLDLYAASGLGQSVTSALGGQGFEKITVRTVPFAEITSALPKAARVAVKIDIEGHEYAIANHIIDFVREHNAPLHLSLHPGIYFRHRRERMGAYAAWHDTWSATRHLLSKLAALGPVTHSRTGRRFTAATLAQHMLLNKKIKNFTVEVGGDPASALDAPKAA